MIAFWVLRIQGDNLVECGKGVLWFIAGDGKPRDFSQLGFRVIALPDLDKCGHGSVPKRQIIRSKGDELLVQPWNTWPGRRRHQRKLGCALQQRARCPAIATGAEMKREFFKEIERRLDPQCCCGMNECVPHTRVIRRKDNEFAKGLHIPPNVALLLLDLCDLPKNPTSVLGCAPLDEEARVCLRLRG